MKNLKLVVLLFLGLAMAIVSCKKDEEVASTTEGTLVQGDVSLSRKTAYGNDWIYYSIKDAQEVDSTNHQNSLSWDIAFNRYNVRTNGGESGIGQGAAYDAGKLDFSAVTEANVSGYIVDDTIQIVKAFTGQGVDWMTSTGNDVFKGCMDLQYGGGAPSYVANDHIYVIKTAEGKYAKIWIKSFYNDLGDSGYISFKYQYQSGEGRLLE
jgi:hypothetical protein